MPSILVVDDDPLLGEIVRFKLEGVGFDVRLVADSTKVVDAVAVQAPDLIVLDSMMPILSGPEVLAQLKRDPATAAIPVVMLTARRGEEDVVRALRGGAEDFLTKPFVPDELILRITAILHRHDAATPNARVA